MKAFVLDGYKKNVQLRLGEAPEPAPGLGEVVVEVHAAGLDPLDSKIRDGEFKPILPYRPPFILGHDVAGVGPPDPDFARQHGLNRGLRQLFGLQSFGIRSKAARRGVDYSFLFMRADGEQLSRITSPVEAGAVRPVLDRVFPFEATNDAFAYFETGRSKGKVVVRVK
jgi:NADPH:quinone reductase-like Zn-dependent oxidoreductase